MNGWNDTNVLPEFKQAFEQLYEDSNLYITPNVLIRLQNGKVFIGHFYYFRDCPYGFCTIEGNLLTYEKIVAWHKIPKFTK